MGLPDPLQLGLLKRTLLSSNNLSSGARGFFRLGKPGFSFGDDYFVQASGVNPITMSNRAASSPMREPLMGAKSTVTEGARLCVCDFFIDSVALVLGLAFDITLRRPLLAPFILMA